MALTGKQIADAVVASARSSGYFKTYDATPNWKDFYDRLATKLTSETPANNDFNVISGHVLTTYSFVGAKNIRRHKSQEQRYVEDISLSHQEGRYRDASFYRILRKEPRAVDLRLGAHSHRLQT